MGIFSVYLDRSRDIALHEAPDLHRVVERLAAKAGIEKPAIRLVNSTHGLNAFQRFTFEHMAAALHPGKPTILLGEKFMPLMGHSSLGASVGEEFEAILAHEIGHLKYNDCRLYKVLPLAFSPHMGVVAGMAGMWYYEHLKEKAEAARRQGVAEDQVQQDIHQEWQASDQPSGMLLAHEHFNKMSKVIAGGLLGFTVGTAVYALTHRHIEFRADRVSAELMENGKPLARALATLRNGLQAKLKSAPEVMESFDKQNPLKKLFYMLTHPSDAVRTERLNSWARA